MTRLDDAKLDDDDPETPDAPETPEEPDVPEPRGPEPKEPSDNRTLTSPINELESRLLRQRKVLIFGAINDKVARDVTGRLLALAATSATSRSTSSSTRRAATSRAATPSTT